MGAPRARPARDRPLVADRDGLGDRGELPRPRPAARQARARRACPCRATASTCSTPTASAVPAGEQGAIAVRLPLPPGALPTLWNDDERCVGVLPRALSRLVPDGRRRAPRRGRLPVRDGAHRRRDQRRRPSPLDRRDGGGRRDPPRRRRVRRLRRPRRAARRGAARPRRAQGGRRARRRGAARRAGRRSCASASARSPASATRASSPRLPKTRSGKILRATMRDIAAGRDYALPATIDDPAIIDEIAGRARATPGPELAPTSDRGVAACALPRAPALLERGVRGARRRRGDEAHGCDAVSAGGRAYALVAPDGRIGVRLPDWDLFAAAFELPGQRAAVRERAARRPLGAAAARTCTRTARRCASGCAMPTRSRRGACERGAGALSFGSVAEDYEATRPGWPLDPFTQVVRALRRAPRPDIVDVAAGTGKLTRTLARVAGSLVAVEPDPALREVIAARAAGGRRASRAPPRRCRCETASADVVCAGQAFHWFDVDAALDRDRARAAPARRRHRGLELAARGRHLVRRRDRLPARREPRPPAGADADWAVGARRHPAFGDLLEVTARHEQPSDHERFARLLGTHSIINAAAARAPRGADRGGGRGGRRAGRVRRRRQLRDPMALRAVRAATGTCRRAAAPPGYTVPVTETALPIRQ